ncbi:MAG: DUF2993 domain-containing protein [Armatimonadetes bacterium]|nr:DUF2993 domain-containing protein [Armatimonadota bacterium]
MFVSTGCAKRLVTGSIERRIAYSLLEIVGPAESYEVKVQGSTRKMMQGRIREVIVHGKGVWAMPDLCLDRLDVRMTEVLADPDTSTLKSVGCLVFEAIASERSLNEYLAATRPDEARVELLDGSMIVRARPRVLGIPASVILTGRLAPRGEKLDFEVEHLEFVGLNTPAVAVEVVENRINPILDLGEMGFEPELESAKIAAGAVTITGKAHLAGTLPAGRATENYRN